MGSMWRLTMYLLCLIAALSGTPLRQAEAANDLARTLGEFGEGRLIEPIDGGVGDDAEASILKAGGDTQSMSTIAFLAMTDVQCTPLIPRSSLQNVSDRCRVDPCGWLPASSVRRLAWLQCFLL
jgi:hypothetical protein